MRVSLEGTNGCGCGVVLLGAKPLFFRGGRRVGGSLLFGGGFLFDGFRFTGAYTGLCVGIKGVWIVGRMGFMEFNHGIL